MTSCPSCFREVAAAVAWVCTSGRCASSVDTVASAYAGTEVLSGPFAVADGLALPRGGPPQPYLCRSCHLPMQEACATCHYPLPPNWRSTSTVCIAMAGARATGKSLYIGVLVKQLERLAARHGSTLVPATDATTATYRRVYESALFEQRGILPPTPSVRTRDSYQREPLVYDLGFINGRRLHVVLRDVAGEDLEEVRGVPTHLQFYGAADGVVFLFDPLRVPTIRGQLRGLVPQQLQSGGDPVLVLAHVLRLIGGGRPRLAVALSKFDAMHALRSVTGSEWSRVMANPGAAFSRDPEAAGFDAADAELLHLEVRSLLQRLHAGAMVNSLENPNSGLPIRHRFFAVSALGGSPNGESLSDRGIAPFRCLDPVRWILAEKGAL